MSEPLDETSAYSLNAWDCPSCDWINTTDADLDSVEECENCSERIRIH